MPYFPRFLLRPAGLALFALASLARPSAAHAVDLGGATIELELRIPDESGENFAVRSEEAVREFFNLAACVCTEDTANPQLFRVRFTLANPPQTLSSPRVNIYVGTQCDSPEARIRDENCELVGSFESIESLRGFEDLDIPVHTLTSLDSPACDDTAARSRFVYAIIDEDGSGISDGDYVSTPLEVAYDLQAPPSPVNIEATGGENAIDLRWDLPETRAEDIRFFQALCMRADGSTSEDDQFPRVEPPAYMTASMLCGEDDGTVPVPAFLAHGGVGVDAGTPDAGSPDAGPAVDPTLPPELASLDPSFLCGQAGASSTGLRIDGLENGVPYRIVFVVADRSRNLRALDLGELTPQPVQDAWEHYKELGGTADGGYCFVATATYGDYDHPFVRILRDFRDGTLARFSLGRRFIDWYYESSPAMASYIAERPWARFLAHLLLHPIVVIAAIWEYTGLVGKLLLFALVVLWRRRRKAGRLQQRTLSVAATAISVVIALLMLEGGRAHAQPYWDEISDAEAPPDTRSHWNFELQLGPYIPAIDDEFRDRGDTARPFEETFGEGPFWMTQARIDHFLLFPEGQLGLTASIGYMGKKKNSFQVDDAGNVLMDEDGDPLRAPGDKTAFRLVPLTLGVVYRATLLDDRFGIPLVPYGRAALAYYLWWFTSPSGKVAEVPTPTCMDAGQPDADCSGNRARGGSLGFQLSAGIALRAERIDPDAESALRNELGIEHAGFFVEASWAEVDGFGADDKLSVGDATWFGGINFEF